MHLIYTDKQEFGYLKQHLIDICNKHREEKRALAFAFILYDFKSPHVKKVLDDNDYVQALHYISGQFLTVFGFQFKDKPRRRPSNTIHTLLSIPIFSDDNHQIDDLMIKYFDNRQIVRNPAILFFQVDNKKVIDTMLLELKGQNVEGAFWEIKEYLTAAVKALEKIDQSYYANHKEVFDCLEREIEHFQSIKKISRFSRNAGGILGMLSSIKGLLS